MQGAIFISLIEFLMFLSLYSCSQEQFSITLMLIATPHLPFSFIIRYSIWLSSSEWNLFLLWDSFINNLHGIPFCFFSFFHVLVAIQSYLGSYVLTVAKPLSAWFIERLHGIFPPSILNIRIILLKPLL